MGLIKNIRTNSRKHFGRGLSNSLTQNGGVDEGTAHSIDTGSSDIVDGGGGAGGMRGDEGLDSYIRIHPDVASTPSSLSSSASPASAQGTLQPEHVAQERDVLSRQLGSFKNKLLHYSHQSVGDDGKTGGGDNDSGSSSLTSSSFSSSLSSSSSISSSSISSSSSSSLSTSLYSSSSSSSSSSPSLSNSLLSSSSRQSSSLSSSLSSSSSSSIFKHGGNDQSNPNTYDNFNQLPFKYQTYNADASTSKSSSFSPSPLSSLSSSNSISNNNDDYTNNDVNNLPDINKIARYTNDRLSEPLAGLKPQPYHAPSAFNPDSTNTHHSPNSYSESIIKSQSNYLNPSNMTSSNSASTSSLLSSHFDSYKRSGRNLPSPLHSTQNNSSSTFLSSSSPSLTPSPSSLNSFYNLGLDPSSSVADLATSSSNQALNLLSSTAVESSQNPFNITEICYNSSASSATLIECWNLFDPNDNFTTGEPPTSTPAGLVVAQRYWAILLVIFPLFTVFGNILVVLSVFKEKSLKTVTNYFICSLAVADIMVAIMVMPFAVFLEVTGSVWTLSDPLCDAYVASDVLACTASILNLTAISVDRFIAVTQPIKYAKHKNSKRVFIMLAVTWVISIAIAAPITLGVNYSELRKPGDCRFYNSDFIIYSSMGSFYIPSIIMIFLYWKIYRVIRQRAAKARRAKALKNVDKRALQGVIENPQATTQSPSRNNNAAGGGNTTTTQMVEATVTTGLAKMDNGRVTTYNTTTSTRAGVSLLKQMSAGGGGGGNGCNLSEDSHDEDDLDDDDDETPSGSGSVSANNNTEPSKGGVTTGCGGPAGRIIGELIHSSPQNRNLVCHVDVPELITNPVAEALERQELAAAAEEELHQGALLKCGNGQNHNSGGGVGDGGAGAYLDDGGVYCHPPPPPPLLPPTGPHQHHDGSAASGSGSGSGSASTSGVGGGQTCALNEAETNFSSMAVPGNNNGNNTFDSSAKEGLLGSSDKKRNNSSGKREHKKAVTKFNFHMRTSRKRKEKSSSKRERKATKTLAIVLGVFLICWVPFFTLNIINAICIRYNLTVAACTADGLYFSLFTWVGYINSFLNPVIYTIFNPEFRKAFRKLLTHPCA